MLDSSLNAEEDFLAEQLRKTCDENGKEKDCNKSALILHKIGKIYQKRSPDMFSLIKSAALYNAAIARDPDNVKEIQEDLQLLCTHILKVSGAKGVDANLIEKSQEVQKMIKQMREDVEQRLDHLQQIPDNANNETMELLEMVKIKDMKLLQTKIADDYIKIMRNVASFCEEVMGESTIKFALAGMGSLARNEITPYSDFENIILLENSKTANAENDCSEEQLNRFRWFSVIIQIILINLQETIIPSIAIFSLNDESSKLGNWFYDSFTTRGISFDGMMPHACKFPLGRQKPTKDKPWKTELIKPVDEMLKYLSSENALKNGYHLSNILTKTCFVYKNKEVFDEFQAKIFDKLENDLSSDIARDEIKKQVVEDLDNFATRPMITKLHSQKKLNVKRAVYRSVTLFILALGRIHNIRASSCFDIVSKLAKKQIISKYAKHKLMYAVAIACEIRLRWYMQHHTQCDDIIVDSEQEPSAIAQLLQIVGKSSTLSYFQIAYALQCDISRRLKLSKHHFYSSPNLFNSSLGFYFEDKDHLSKFLSLENEQVTLKTRFYNFDDCLKYLNPKTNTQIVELKIYPIHYSREFRKLGEKLLEFGCYDDSLECFRYAALEHHKTIKNFPNDAYQETLTNDMIRNNKFLGDVYMQMAKICQHIGKPKETLQCSLKAIEIYQIMMLDSVMSNFSNSEKAALFRGIGCCFLFSSKPHEALDYFTKSLQLLESISKIDNCDNKIADIKFLIGRCLLEMKEPEAALAFFERAIQIKKKLLPGEITIDIAEIYFCIRYCLIEMQKPSDAITQFQKALCLAETKYVDIRKNYWIQFANFWIGLCHLKEEKPNDAIEFFQKSLKIQENNSLDCSTDISAAVIQYWIGLCWKDLNKPVKAIACLQAYRSIQERLSSNKNNDNNIALTFHSIGLSFLDSNKPMEALDAFIRSLQIKNQLPRCVAARRSIATTFYWIGCCLEYLNKKEKAQVYFDESVSIIENIIIPKYNNW